MEARLRQQDELTCLPRQIRLRFSETLKPNFDKFQAVKNRADRYRGKSRSRRAFLGEELAAAWLGGVSTPRIFSELP